MNENCILKSKIEDLTQTQLVQEKQVEEIYNGYYILFD
jgi:hypothetical protein